MQAEVLDNRLLGDIPYEAQPVAPSGEDVGVYALPRGGVRFTPVPAFTLHANAGSYVRAPDFTELFGSSVGIVGNTDLLPERGTSWEVGGHLDLVAGSAPPVLPFGATLDVAFARARVHDLIAYEPNSQQTEHAVNVGEAFVQTAEGGLVLCAGDVADTSTSVTWTVARNLVADAVYANKALPNVAPWEVSHTTRLHWQDRFALSHTWTYTGATYTDAANANLQAPRSLHALALSVVPVRGGPTLSAEVLNLLDARGMAVRRNPYDDADQTLVVKPLTDFAGYPLPGRTFMVGATWQPHPKE
jgi:outer membrane receptor protein involved in Fe transport